MKSFVLLIIYSDSLNAANSFERYYAKAKVLWKVFKRYCERCKYVIKQVYRKYLTDIIKQQMVQITVIIISMTTICLPWIMNEKHEKHPLLVILSQGKKGNHILKSFKKGMVKVFLNNVKPQIAFTGRKVGTSFQIKDKTEMKPNYDIEC